MLKGYKEAKKSGAYYKNTGFSVIEISGSDAPAFLHRILSNDIASLKAGDKTTACFLTPEAKIIAYFHVFYLGDRFQLICASKVKEKAIADLRKLIILDDVALCDRSSEFSIYFIFSPEAKNPFSLSYFKSGDDKMEIPHLNEEAYEILRIEAGRPKWGVDFDSSHIPLECGLEASISLSKGCYPGQEILARLDSRGGVAKKLVKLVFDKTPYSKTNQGTGTDSKIHAPVSDVQGDLVTKEGNQIGSITSTIYSPSLSTTIALAYLKKGYWGEGTEVTVKSSRDTVCARVELL
jgi:tRNA-modifying protein YgfZ